MTQKASSPDIDPATDLWPGPDGQAIDCREKLAMLRANHAEVAQVLRDVFEDAILMGVETEAMRALLHRLVDELRDPRVPPEARL